MKESDILQKIKKAIDLEIKSILYFRENLDNNFANAVQMIYESKGKLVLTGVGKSGDIAKKISSTMISTGTTSIFVHPTDAAHGDAGVISKDDILLAIGKSGESEELILFVQTAKRLGAKIIGMTANVQSKLATESNLVLHTQVLQEACPLELAPTSSTTIALIAGDAMAMALMELKNFTAENFAMYHPSGRLGKRLSLNIEDVMRKNEQNPKVLPTATITEIIEVITSKSVGAVSVVDESNHLLGLITDYDIRKLFQQEHFDKSKCAQEIMNSKPTSFQIGSKAYNVLVSMENRIRPISVAPIVDSNQFLVGLVSLHDLIQLGLK